MSRKANLVVQEMDGELLIYDLSSNKAFCLNQTSAIVWQLCDGQRTIEEISQTLETRLNSPANEDLVWFAIDQLRKEKLIENEAELNNHFAGMSRREVIKKVGLGTMIALPIVGSMVAPSAIQAQSIVCNTATACTCTADVGMGMTCTEVAPAVCNGVVVGMTTCVCVQTNNGNVMGTCLLN